jgi:hypothetical protein
MVAALRRWGPIELEPDHRAAGRHAAAGHCQRTEVLLRCAQCLLLSAGAADLRTVAVCGIRGETRSTGS